MPGRNDDVRFRIGAPSDDLSRDLAQADRMIDRFAANGKTRLSGIDKGFDGLSRGILGINRILPVLGGVLAGVSAGAMVQFIRRATEAGAEIADVADKLGQTTDAVQVFRYAAEQQGVALHAADQAFQRFVRRVGEAQQGIGELLPVFQQYNIQLRNADGTARSTTDVLGDLAEVTKNQGNAQEQLRIAFKAFDSEGAQMVNVLRKGRDGLIDYGVEARHAGAVLEESLVKQAKEARAQLQLSSQVISTQLNGALISLTPVLVDSEDLLARMAKYLNEIGQKAGLIYELNARSPGAMTERAFSEAYLRKLREIADMEREIGRLENQRVRGGADEQRLAALRDQVVRAREELNRLNIEAGRRRGEAQQATTGPEAVPPQVQATIQALERQRFAIGLSEEQLAAFNALVQAHQVTIKDGTATYGPYAEAIVYAAYAIAQEANAYKEVEAAETKADAARVARINAEIAHGKALLDAKHAMELEVDQNHQLNETLGESVVAYDQLRERLEIVNGLRAKGFTEDEIKNYEKLIEQVQASRKAIRDHQAAIGELQDFADRAFDRIGGAITDAFAKGEIAAVDFGNLARAVISEIMQEFIKLAAINPLKNALFGTDAPTLGGAGGLLGLIFGGGGGSSTFATSAAAGGYLTQGSLVVGATPFHSGGEVGRDHPAPRLTDPRAFIGAPRLHDGLMPDEYRAILQKGETVIPKDKTIMGGPQMVINADMRGAAPEAVDRLEAFARTQQAQLNRIDHTLESRAVKAVGDNAWRAPRYFPRGGR